MLSSVQSLINLSGYSCLFWVGIQQIVVASSTIFIVKAISHSTSGNINSSIGYIIAFILSLFVVLIPYSLSVIQLEKWKLTSFRNFVDYFTKENYGITIHSQRGVREESEPWLSQESIKIYKDATDILYQLISTMLNSGLSIVAIGFVLDYSLLLFYLIAGSILVTSGLLLKSKIANASSRMQKDSKNLGKVMLKAWENILTGNSYNLLNWKRNFSDSYARLFNSSPGYEATRTIFSNAVVSICLVVVVLGNARLFIVSLDSPGKIAALLVTMPRQVQIVQSIFACFGHYMSWKGVGSRLKDLSQISHIEKSAENLIRHISFGDITVTIDKGTTETHHPVSMIDDLHNLCKNYPYGRFTIKGRNGSGKSVLLSILAQKTGDESFYLPAGSKSLAFSKSGFNLESEGTKVLTALNEIEKLDQFRILLLDEWDANLNPSNTRKLNIAIGDIAKHRLVLEVRHHS